MHRILNLLRTASSKLLNTQYKFVILITTILLILLSFLWPQKEKTVVQIQQEYLKYTYHVVGADAQNQEITSGTGSAINYKGHVFIVTARHVCRLQVGLGTPLTAFDRRWIYNPYTRTQYPLNILYISETDDVCVLMAPNNIPALKLTDDESHYTDHAVYTTGFTLETIFTSKGYIWSKEPMLVRLPVFNISNKLEHQVCTASSPFSNIVKTPDNQSICICLFYVLPTSLTAEHGVSGAAVYDLDKNVFGLVSLAKNGFTFITPKSAIIQALETVLYKFEQEQHNIYSLPLIK